MNERIAVIEGVRTPFCKAGGVLSGWEADDLGAFAIKELLAKISLSRQTIDELIFGNVIQPPHAANIARVLSIKGGLGVRTPAFTVNRNCASGMEAMITAANKLRVGAAAIVIAGGTESMSNVPILFNQPARTFIRQLSKAKTVKAKIHALVGFRPKFLKPEVPAIADPICSMTMGETAEVLAREFHVGREEQDAFAVMSQQRAARARTTGVFAEEIVPVPRFPSFDVQEVDDGVREDSTLEGLAKLKPVFDRLTGTVTAGNASQVTDGAAAVLLMLESKAKELELDPLGYVREASVAGLDPARMGLGPAFAIAQLLEKTQMQLRQFDLIEINEAFAAQVIAVERALNSEEFCMKELGKKGPIGMLDRDKMNVNGGAIALGHPIGASGTRLVLTLLKELRRRNQNLGLAALCVGGGQGEAVIVEVS